MGKFYKLIDGIQTVTTLNVARNQNGQVGYSHVRLFPGERYELEEDATFIQSLKNAKVERAYSKQLQEELEAWNIDYSEKRCQACGNRVKKLSYAVVEIIDE